VTGNKNDGITVQKGRQVIKFDIRVETPKGALWCAYIKWPEPDCNIATGVSNGNPAKQTIVSMQEILPPAIKVNIEKAHAILLEPKITGTGVCFLLQFLPFSSYLCQ
jgi:hypothetical protein